MAFRISNNQICGSTSNDHEKLILCILLKVLGPSQTLVSLCAHPSTTHHKWPSSTFPECPLGPTKDRRHAFTNVPSQRSSRATPWTLPRTTIHDLLGNSNDRDDGHNGSNSQAHRNSVQSSKRGGRQLTHPPGAISITTFVHRS